MAADRILTLYHPYKDDKYPSYAWCLIDWQDPKNTFLFHSDVQHWRKTKQLREKSIINIDSTSVLIDFLSNNVNVATKLMIVQDIWKVFPDTKERITYDKLDIVKSEAINYFGNPFELYHLMLYRGGCHSGNMWEYNCSLIIDRGCDSEGPVLSIIPIHSTGLKGLGYKDNEDRYDPKCHEEMVRRHIKCIEKDNPTVVVLDDLNHIRTLYKEYNPGYILGAIRQVEKECKKAFPAICSECGGYFEADITVGDTHGNGGVGFVHGVVTCDDCRFRNLMTADGRAFNAVWLYSMSTKEIMDYLFENKINPREISTNIVTLQEFRNMMIEVQKKRTENLRIPISFFYEFEDELSSGFMSSSTLPEDIPDEPNSFIHWEPLSMGDIKNINNMMEDYLKHRREEFNAQNNFNR